MAGWLQAREQLRPRDQQIVVRRALATVIRRMDDAERVSLAVSAGIPKSVVDHASGPSEVNTEGFMALCFGLGIEPRTGSAVEARRVPIEIAWPLLSEDIKAKLHAELLPYRAAGKLTGLSHATLSRACNSFPLSVEVFFTICDWLGVPCERYAVPRSPGAQGYVETFDGRRPRARGSYWTAERRAAHGDLTKRFMAPSSVRQRIREGMASARGDKPRDV